MLLNTKLKLFRCMNDEINIIINSINKMGELVISRQKIAILLKDIHYLLWFQRYFIDSSLNFNDLLVNQKNESITVGSRTKYNTKRIFRSLLNHYKSGLIYYE